jgi:thiol-disulfide isomerase/thioredoxin
MEGENKYQKFFKERQFLFGILIGIISVIIVGVIIFAVAFVIGGREDNSAATLNTDSTNSQQQLNAQGPATASVTASGISTFSMKKDAKICKENGKPVVYLFSTTWCVHCQWIKSTFDSVMAKYVKEGKIVAYHWEVDTGDNTLTSAVEKEVPANAQAVYSEFNPQGSIPTFVFGCKYFRVGNGYESKSDLASEIKEFEAVVKNLTK